MLPLSYRSPKTEVRESKIHGRGLFATADIAKDEIVAVKGGRIVDRKTLREKIAPRLGSVEIQIDNDLFIAPVTDEERELSMLYSNHSCDANLGMRGGITFVAMRDIRAGEELTHDWATTDDDDCSVECKCGAQNRHSLPVTYSFPCRIGFLGCLAFVLYALLLLLFHYPPRTAPSRF